MSERDDKEQWRNDKPPNEVWVAVKNGDEVLEAMAIYGRDGCLPHWRQRNGPAHHPSRFNRWRELKTDDI